MAEENDPIDHHLRTYYVPSSEHDGVHRNVENRLNALDQRVFTLQSQHTALDHSVNNVIAQQSEILTEQRVSRQERISMLAILQGLARNTNSNTDELARLHDSLHGVKNMQALGWMAVAVLVFCVLLKVW